MVRVEVLNKKLDQPSIRHLVFEGAGSSGGIEDNVSGGCEDSSVLLEALSDTIMISSFW